MSSVPHVRGPHWLPVGDKVAHFGLFAVLGGTLAWGRHRSEARVAHGWLLLIGILYGMSDEWHQMYVPGRTPDLADWLADAFGVVTGYGTTWALLGRTRADPASTEGRHEEEPEQAPEEEPTGDGS